MDIKKLLMIMLLFDTLLAEQIFFMPYDKRDALKTMKNQIDRAENSIDIAIYSFTHKELVKRLKSASKRGVRVKIIFDKKQNSPKNRYSKLPNLAKIKNIECRLLDGLRYKNGEKSFGKMHNKFMIIDNQIVIFGSANFSHTAFSKSYEILYIKKSYQLAKKFKNYFDRIYKISEKY